MYISDQILSFDLNTFQFVEFVRILNPLLFTGLGSKIPCKKQKSVNNLLPFSQKQCFSTFSFLHTDIVIGATCFFPATV